MRKALHDEATARAKVTAAGGLPLADLDLPFAADVLCYTPEEFARKRREHGIVRLALEEGLRL